MLAIVYIVLFYLLIRFPIYGSYIFPLLCCFPILLLVQKNEAQAIVYTLTTTFIGVLGSIIIFTNADVEQRLLIVLSFLSSVVFMWSLYICARRYFEESNLLEVRYKNEQVEIDKQLKMKEFQINELEKTIDTQEQQIKLLSKIAFFSNQLLRTLKKEELINIICKFIPEIIGHGHAEIVLFKKPTSPDDVIGNFLLFPIYKRSIAIYDTSIYPTIFSRPEFSNVKSILLEAIDTSEGESVSVYGYISLKDSIQFSEDEYRFFTVLSSISKVNLINSFLYENVEELSITDDQTGVYTHKFFKEKLELEFNRAKFTNTPLGMFIVDIDNFKQINDKYGHQEGDNVLKEMANILKTALRKIDTLARYGGDEFVAILPLIKLEFLYDKCEEIRMKIINNISTKETKISVSIGAGCIGEDVKNYEEFIMKVDKNLYEAKMQGKNRIVVK